ncbi:MAG: CDP-6-deoxy-delta-3,4-glucoseen reductase [Rhodocyclaceae bacterium]|jgi:CDP-4-dehydro-6-deoxyglucose reductase|nr:CDP-6-deoxy-delta-3,4-glucoseen reductase [Rhodocyclaceae bacterium]
MQFKIQIAPDDLEFVADDAQTILEAALAAGLLLPYSCRDGACGACKAELLQGSVCGVPENTPALSADDLARGQTLLCQAKPLSDLHIRPRSIARVGDIPARKMPCRVQTLERAADDVMIVTLKLPSSEQFRFRAGQYVDFLLSDGRRRSFSIASPPEVTDTIELHVRKVAGGHFTGHVFETMKARDILRMEGPLGSFFLREDSDRPIILLAGGTGFAPIKSIVEHAIATGCTRPMRLYWGARNRAGLYQDTLARSWETRLPDFRYTPVLSEATPEEAWQGRSGLVHHVVMEDYPDMQLHEVYACGAPAMIEVARQDFFGRCKLPEAHFHADAFTFANDSHN